MVRTLGRAYVNENEALCVVPSASFTSSRPQVPRHALSVDQTKTYWFRSEEHTSGLQSP